MLTSQRQIMLTPKQFHGELANRGYEFSYETVRRWFRKGLVKRARKVGGRYFVSPDAVDEFITTDVFGEV